MTLTNFLFVCNENNYDVDIYTDYTDELGICYCGDEDFKLTEEGMNEFSDILDLDVEWDIGDCDAIIQINKFDEEKADRLNKKLIKFFNACAGYVSDSLYKKWFNAD